MKTAGYILIGTGFVAGALVSVLHVEEIMWGYFALALAVGAAGVVLMRTAQKREQTATDTVRDNLRGIEESLAGIVERIEALNREKGAIDPYEIRHRIDRDFADDLQQFVDARESIGHAYGLETYADVMMHFAAGERYLNRVWSASADGYVDEAHAYLERAETQFQEATAKLQRSVRD